MSMLLRILTLAVLSLGLYAEDSLDDMVKKTDMSNPDQVLALAQWCTDHNLPTTSRHYYQQVIKLDHDNETARTALGEVKVNDHWVSQSQAAISNPAAAKDPAVAGSAIGNAPTSAQISWDLRPPKDPQPDNDFITGYIDKLPSLKNDSSDMDNAIATMLTDENFPMALPRLCAALTKPSFTDLYAAGMMVETLSKDGKLELAKPLLGFMVKATEHVTDPEDIATAVFAIGLFKDVRALPRLIELYDFPNDDKAGQVKEAVGNAVASITALPSPVTKEQAQEWWKKNYNVDPHQLFLQQLKSSNPQAQIEAAAALYDLQDKVIFPVLVKLLEVDDREVNRKAIFLIKRMVGLDFNYLESNDPKVRQQRAQLAGKWWKDNGEHYQFPQVQAPVVAQETPTTPATTAADNAEQWVSQLSASTGNTADQAGSNLRANGMASVPALVAGLESTAAVVRSRCNAILKTITKQDFLFNAMASEDDRAKAVAAWKSWATNNAPVPAQDNGKDK
jgi:HEAT repeat protein